MTTPDTITDPDVILVGSGIMSATLGVMLKCLEPRLKIQLFEAHSEFARESSDGWNNAGTGHAALCEITYTPGFGPDGSVNIARSLAVRAADLLPERAGVLPAAGPAGRQSARHPATGQWEPGHGEDERDMNEEMTKAFRQAIQIGVVVRDLEQSMAALTAVFGIGPFHVVTECPRG